MHDKMQSYRQPMVTATGILLGFILNYAINWVSTPSSLKNVNDAVSLAGLLSSFTLLSLTLYRILNMNYPAENAVRYYQRTLFCFITGLGCIFLSLLVVMIRSFLISADQVSK